jgi:RNA polymerase sigma factor (sigma-70 family)
VDHDPDEVAGGSDAELITRVRSGDRAAFGQLYSRHAAAAANLARQFARAPSEVDDLVSEAFARVLDSLLGGRGPDSAFRAYLFTTLRNTAFDRTRKDRRLQFTDDITVHESPEVADDPVVLQLENTLVAKAFGALPERWQTVLWHTQVEGQSPAEVGVLLGMAPNAVTSLAFRAREGLREAYLQAHLADTAAERCRATVDRLGGWARGGLSKRERTQVDAHLADCERCSALAAELAEINTSLRGLLAPLLLGGAAAGYLASLGNAGIAVPLGAATGATVGTAAVGTTAGSTAAGSTAGTATGQGAGAGGAAAAAGSSSSWGLWGLLARPWALATAGAGVAAAVVTGVVIAFGGTGAQQPLANEPPPVSPVTNSPGTGSTAGTGPSGVTGSTGVTGTSGVTGSSGSTPSSPATSGSSGPGTTPVQPTGTRPTTAGSDSATGGPGGSTGGQTLPPVVVPGSPGTTSTASSTIGPSTAPTTSIPSTVFTTISTGVPSSPAPGSSTNGTPITSSTSPATSTSMSTTSTASTSSPPVTTPPPTAELSDPVVGTAFLDAVAGAPADVTFSVTNSGDAPSARQDVTLAGPDGVSLVGGTGSTSSATDALRLFSALLMPRLFVPADTGLVNCDPTGCTYFVPAHTTLTVTLNLYVSPDTQPGAVVLTLDDTAFTLPMSVDSGLTQLQLTSPLNGWTAGQTVRSALTAQVQPKVSDAGTITLPLRAGVLWITNYPDGCSPTGKASITCVPAFGADTSTVRVAPLTITVLPTGRGDQKITATLSGGRSASVGSDGRGTIWIDALGPGDPIDMTGPFGANLVGAAMMQCDKPVPFDRQTCRMSRMDSDPASRLLQVPVGATVVSAELMWAATRPDTGSDDAKDCLKRAPGPLDCITLNLDDGPHPLVGVAPPGAPDTPGELVVRAADVTSLMAAGGSVNATGLAASTSSSTNLPAMAAWSLVVVWAFDDDSSSRVQVDNSLTDSSSTKGGTVTTVAAAGSTIEGFWTTLWAVDDWAAKSLAFDPARNPNPLPVTIDGNCMAQGGPVAGAALLQYACGFQVLGACSASSAPRCFDPAALQDSAGAAIRLTNSQVGSRIDRLWIGPTLVIRVPS